ncbi:hypothetical protein [Carnobacterium sp.]|uniref:hypothetical protein n=1 Tax=Carnobacterium sp. TaxID=48221 RepID=UPI002FC6E983
MINFLVLFLVLFIPIYFLYFIYILVRYRKQKDKIYKKLSILLILIGIFLIMSETFLVSLVGFLFLLISIGLIIYLKKNNKIDFLFKLSTNSLKFKIIYFTIIIILSSIIVFKVLDFGFSTIDNKLNTEVTEQVNSYSDFNKLKKNMTLEKVEKIFGKPNELISEDIWQYTANDDDNIPRTIRIYFRDEQVSSFNLSFTEGKKKDYSIDPSTNSNEASSTDNNMKAEKLDTGLSNIQDKNNSYIVEIKQFSSKWDHIQIILSDNFTDLSTDGKEEFVKTISSDVRGIIGGYSNQDPTKIFFTFSNSDYETLAESSAFDVYNIKVK